MKDLKKQIILCFFATITLCKSQADTTFLNTPKAYFGEKRPGNVSQVFGDSFLNVDGYSIQNPSFSPDGKEFLFNVFNEKNNTYTIFETRYTQGNWSKPTKVSFLGILNDKQTYEPHHHPNGLELVLTGEGELYFSQKKNKNSYWGEVKKLVSPINAYHSESASFNINGNLYFWSNREKPDDYEKADLYEALKINGEYKLPRKLTFPLNSDKFDGDPYISSDGKVMIFTSNRALPGNILDGGTELYISYHKSGRWTNPKKLGPEINKVEGWNYNPYLTPDGKYLIYGNRKTGDNGFSKMYWVSTHFIDSLYKTNFLPYVISGIPDQKFKAGAPIAFSIPKNTFFDDDEKDTLSISATLAEGKSLPYWLHFNPSTMTFSGTPPSMGIYTIAVTASDGFSNAVTPPIQLTIE